MQWSSLKARNGIQGNIKQARFELKKSNIVTKNCDAVRYLNASFIDPKMLINKSNSFLMLFIHLYIFIFDIQL